MTNPSKSYEIADLGQLPVAIAEFKITKDDRNIIQMTVYPNWFHRTMQRLCFGFHWEKITKEKT